MAKKETLTVEQVIAAIHATKGAVYLTAEKLKKSARTIFRYAEKHEEIREALDHYKGQRLDKAEGMLWRAVENGEAWAICFFLKTQGKERGYIERTQVQQEGVCKVLILDNTPGEEPFDPDSA